MRGSERGGACPGPRLAARGVAEALGESFLGRAAADAECWAGGGAPALRPPAPTGRLWSPAGDAPARRSRLCPGGGGGGASRAALGPEEPGGAVSPGRSGLGARRSPRPLCFFREGRGGPVSEARAVLARCDREQSRAERGLPQDPVPLGGQGAGSRAPSSRCRSPTCGVTLGRARVPPWQLCVWPEPRRLRPWPARWFPRKREMCGHVASTLQGGSIGVSMPGDTASRFIAASSGLAVLWASALLPALVLAALPVPGCPRRPVGRGF